MFFCVFIPTVFTTIRRQASNFFVHILLPEDYRGYAVYPRPCSRLSDSGCEPQKDAPSVCILMCDGKKEWCAKGLPSALSMSNA